MGRSVRDRGDQYETRNANTRPGDRYENHANHAQYEMVEVCTRPEVPYETGEVGTEIMLIMPKTRSGRSIRDEGA